MAQFLSDVDLKGSLLLDSNAGTLGYVLKSQGAGQKPIWAAEASASVTIGSSASDILSASGGEITGDTAGGDKIVFWDNSSSKLTYLEIGSGLSISGTTISAESTGGINPVISSMIF